MPTAQREIRLTLPRPHTAQQRIIREAARFNVVCLGRRAGKSVLGVDRLIQPALQGDPVAFFAPSFPMMTEIWREVKNVLQPITSRVSVQDHRLELITGGVVDMWSLDNADSARGRKYRRVVLDEAAMVKDLEGAWNAVIRPTLTDYKGDGWFLSTPRGRNFFWQTFTYGQDELYPEWACWQMPTTANPYIDPEEVEAARQALPERVFQQEYLALFIENSGGVFRGVSECIRSGQRENEAPVKGMGYTLGVDLARVQDFTVLSVLDANRRQVYFERFNQISWERQIGAIERVWNAYHQPQIVLDTTGVGDPIFEALRKKGMKIHPYHFSNATKEALIDNLALLIEGQEISLMDLPTQTAELMAYEYELTPSRNVRMNAPVGMHDDTVIALALAAWFKKKERFLRFN
jgi:phage FluMu gp28-like protein